jgi:hypothetical protein
MTNHTPNSTPSRKVSIEQIADAASGVAGPALMAEVQSAATRDPRVAKLLSSFTSAVVAMKGDLLHEPSAETVMRAKALGARLAPRRAESRSPITMLGEVFDRAGAVVLEWLNPDNGIALAGVRDDHGADVFEAVVDTAQITIRAERTIAKDGIVRMVGEVMRGDDMPVKAIIAVLDADGVVLSTDATDALGMFAINLPIGSCEVVVSARAVDSTVHPTIVLPLGPGSPMRGGAAV